jgi:glycosyltransferase involved in cell wall biosynthesis
MRIAFITAGAAGMYCGSCMHDNTLANGLIQQGHDALLIPTYTPIRTDEADASYSKVFFGGINVYLQQKSWLFRHTPRFLDRLLDFKRLLRWVSRFAVKTKAEDLGDLTLSMLLGKDGNQSKEVERLVDFLEFEFKPEIIILTNVLLSGMVPELKHRVKVPVLGTLQGDDIFLEMLPEKDRHAAMAAIRNNAKDLDGYLVTSEYYADFMADYLSIDRSTMDVVYPGLDLKAHGGPRRELASSVPIIGYFARIAPEKGLHNLVDAFIELRKMPDAPKAKLKISGWLGDHRKGYLEEQRLKLQQAGLLDDFEHVDSPSLADKVRFLQSVDVLSVPTTYREPKGLYLLEAWANGLPVVQPRHGSFPELIEASQGGILCEPDNPEDLARALHQLLSDPVRMQQLGAQGKQAVFAKFNVDEMTRNTVTVLEKYLTQPALKD